MGGTVSAGVIETRGLRKTFGSVLALDDLTLSVPQGSIFGCLGPNGAGKTTTIRVLLGLLRPTAGEAYLLGERILPGGDLVSRVGAMVERPAFYPYLSARDNLLLFAAARGIRSPLDAELSDLALGRAGLTDVARRGVGGFSSGMRQRLGIALALLRDPPLVILDEPTAGLDPEGTIDVRELITGLAQAGTTVFLSTHLLAEAEQLCTQIAVLHRGRMVTSGPTADLFAARQHLWLRFAEATDRDAGIRALAAVGIAADPDGSLSCTIATEPDGTRVIRHLADAGIYPAEVAIRRPSLEQLYIELTGGRGSERAA
jgi:ABC-2 type transport system ATP-binding protein